MARKRSCLGSEVKSYNYILHVKYVSIKSCAYDNLEYVRNCPRYQPDIQLYDTFVTGNSSLTSFIL